MIGHVRRVDLRALTLTVIPVDEPQKPGRTVPADPGHVRLFHDDGSAATLKWLADQVAAGRAIQVNIYTQNGREADPVDRIVIWGTSAAPAPG